jgi:hypothetical protein
MHGQQKVVKQQLEEVVGVIAIGSAFYHILDNLS